MVPWMCKCKEMKNFADTDRLMKRNGTELACICQMPGNLINWLHPGSKIEPYQYVSYYALVSGTVIGLYAILYRTFPLLLYSCGVKMLHDCILTHFFSDYMSWWKTWGLLYSCGVKMLHDCILTHFFSDYMSWWKTWGHWWCKHSWSYYFRRDMATQMSPEGSSHSCRGSSSSLLLWRSYLESCSIPLALHNVSLQRLQPYPTKWQCKLLRCWERIIDFQMCDQQW